MPRILVAECKQEVSSFNPVTTHLQDFDISYGDEILYLHRGGQLELRRHHADDRYSALLDSQRLPDDSGVAAEAPLPQAVAQDYDVAAAVLKFLRPERASE